jgi:hypothetical protein
VDGEGGWKGSQVSKTLKIWNGRDWKAQGHIYVAAYSKKQALELVRKAAGYEGACSMHEINVYWSAGCWGNSMDGITPEVGVWHSPDYNTKPVKLV